MERVTVLISLFAVIALGLSIWQTSRLAILAINQPGIGRVLFFAQTSLKLWAAMVLMFFLVNTLNPGWAGDHDAVRLGVRIFLSVYLVLQALAVNVAVYRWKKREKDDYSY